MTTVDYESPATQSYLGILQAVIGRMASNSASAKAWCIALVSAVLVIIADKENPDYVWIAAIPTLLFLFLDSYYLGLEQAFRKRYNNFVRKLHAGEATLEDTFILTPYDAYNDALTSTFGALLSPSVWPFYGMLSLMLGLVRLWIL